LKSRATKGFGKSLHIGLRGAQATRAVNAMGLAKPTLSPDTCGAARSSFGSPKLDATGQRV
jgi:hypothetical protein